MESYPRLLNHAEDIYGTEINPIVISRQSYLGRQRGGSPHPNPTLFIQNNSHPFLVLAPPCPAPFNMFWKF